MTPVRLTESLAKIVLKLKNRVEAAYTFGSASTGTISPESDIDLILVVNDPKRPFVQRGFDFLDLYEVYPKLDILVYTQSELEAQLGDSLQGFWKSVRLSLRRIL